MKQIQLYTIGLVTFFLLMPVASRAQHFDPAHRHSVEITSGPAPLRELQKDFTDRVRPGLGRELALKGQSGSVIWQPSINISYTYSFNKHWDINLMVNFSTTFYNACQYAIVEEPGDTHSPKVDWESGPIDRWKANTGLSYALMVHARYRWLRTELLSLYSALGLGVAKGVGPWPTPYISPIGINIGKNHFYGIAELNISSAATYGLLGVGFRF